LKRLVRPFFERYTPDVARDLLGCRLVRVLGRQRLSGIIVETEAYRGFRDPASHAYGGKTSRNAVMFGGPGHCYVYFTYGFHYCLNVTTEQPGIPGAVLIRAIEPSEGVWRMVRNRGLESPEHVSDGPGKLTRALGVDKSFNGEDLVLSKKIFIEKSTRPSAVGNSARVGITRGTSLRWRYFAVGNRFVSRAKPAGPDPQNP
jgi:DNA-3-methyladenine glycosylase